MDKNDQSTQDLGTYLLWGLIFGLVFGFIIKDVRLGLVLALLASGVWYSYKVKTGNGSKKLSRSRDNQMIGGVCGGLARYFDIDPSIVRIAYVVFTLVTGIWVGILLYLFLFILMHDNS